MATKHDLLAAIIADPDDDAPRLVYADSLIEVGDPRGELIAVQCELARLGTPSIDTLVRARGDANTLSRCASLLRRQNQLLHQHRARWLAESLGGELKEDCWAVFHRGFPEEVTLRSKDVMSAISALRTRSPLRSLEILHTTDAVIAALARLSFPALRTLKLVESQQLTSDLRTRLLAAAPDLEHLELTRPAPFELATLDVAPRLLSLSVGYVADQDPVEALSVLSFARNLRSLALYPVEAHLARSITRDALDGRFPALDRFVVPSATNEVLHDLARCAQPRLPRNLVIQNNGFGIPGLSELLSMPALSRVESLDLKWNQMEDDGVRAIADCPYLSGLQAISLHGARFTDRGAQALAESRSACLRIADLEDNWLGAAGLAALLGSRRHAFEEVAYAYRRNKQQGVPGNALAQVFAAEPRASSLRRLSIQDARIDDVGVAALAGSEHLAGLRSLDLHGNLIQDAGAAALATSAKLPNLVDLRILYNPMSDRGALAFASSDALANLVNLRLWLTGWKPGVEVVDALAAKLGEGRYH